METPENVFLISAIKDREPVLKTKNGFEIVVPTTAKKFNKYDAHIVTQDGVVCAVPKRVNGSEEYDIKLGDHVFGTHFMCDQEKEITVNGETYYANSYDSLYCTEKDGEITMLGRWNFVVPIYEPLNKIKTTSGIFLTHVHEELNNMGKIVHLSKKMKEEGVKVGDIVTFPNDRECEIIVNDEMYYRICDDDIIAVLNGVDYEQKKQNMMA